MQIRQRIFTFTDIQVLHFFLDTIWEVLTHHTLVSTNCCKVIHFQKQSGFRPTLYILHIFTTIAIIGVFSSEM